MGNRSSHHTGKVVLPDGSIHEFNEPPTVAELMLEHPQQVVVELSCKSSKSNFKLTKPIPLAADNKLELDKVYLMMPLRRGKLPSFSPQDAHQILLSMNTILRAQSRIRSSSRLLPLVAKICAETGANGPSRLAAENEDDELESGVGKKEYLTRQVSGRAWKPNLDTIEEKREGRKELNNLVAIAGKVGRRIETKGLVWG